MADENATARYRRWYRKLLRLYPQPHRERFGEGMEQTFNDMYRERKEAGLGSFGFLLWVFGETLAATIKENIRVMTPIIRAFGSIIFAIVGAAAMIIASLMGYEDAWWIILVIMFVVPAIFTVVDAHSKRNKDK
jgi:hypothetical protein